MKSSLWNFTLFRIKKRKRKTILNGRTKCVRNEIYQHHSVLFIYLMYFLMHTYATVYANIIYTYLYVHGDFLFFLLCNGYWFLLNILSNFYVSYFGVIFLLVFIPTCVKKIFFFFFLSSLKRIFWWRFQYFVRKLLSSFFVFYCFFTVHFTFLSFLVHTYAYITDKQALS